MTSRKFEMHLVVPARLIGTVIEVLNDECDVLSVEKHHHHPDKKRHHTRNRSGSFAGGATGRQEILQKLKETGGQTQGQLTQLFITKKRAPNSVSPLISTLNAEGCIKQDANGVWSLTAKGQAAAKELDK